jgi:hypothetical protein
VWQGQLYQGLLVSPSEVMQGELGLELVQGLVQGLVWAGEFQ